MTLEKARADEVVRLSALQSHEDLIAEAASLWPAHPQNIARYEDWIERATALVGELPEHRATRDRIHATALSTHWS